MPTLAQFWEKLIPLMGYSMQLPLPDSVAPFTTWLKNILQHHSMQSFLILLEILIPNYLWIIWTNRNKNLFEGQHSAPSALLATNLATQYWYLAGDLRKKQNFFTLYIKWKPPKDGCLILNTDATLGLDNNIAGLAGIFVIARWNG